MEYKFNHNAQKLSECLGIKQDRLDEIQDEANRIFHLKINQSEMIEKLTTSFSSLELALVITGMLIKFNTIIKLTANLGEIIELHANVIKAIKEDCHEEHTTQ